MRLRETAVAVMCLVAALAVVGISDDVEADDGDAFYCYSHQMTFEYIGTTPDLEDVRWTAVGVVDGVEEDMEVTLVEESDSWAVTLDSDHVSECSEVRITQTVVRGDETLSETNTFYPVMDLEEDEVLTVAFYDGVSDLPVFRPITEKTVVPVGDDFVEVPSVPQRDGYSFAGWFTSDGEEFDPKEPVTSDMNLYARWMSASGGGQSVTVDNIFVVAFQVQEGFDYHIESVESDGVVFTVTVRDGYSFAGDPDVTTTSGKITVDGDRYTLSSITSNAVVTIVGNPIYDVNPDDPSVPAEDGGLPWIWIIVVIAIVLLALSAYMYCRSRQDDGTDGSRLG